MLDGKSKLKKFVWNAVV